VNRELVTAQVVDAEIEGRFELSPPVILRTPIEAIDQVDRDCAETRLTQDLCRTTCFILAVPATKESEIGVIKGLNSEAHKMDTEIVPGRCP